MPRRGLGGGRSDALRRWQAPRMTELSRCRAPRPRVPSAQSRQEGPRPAGLLADTAAWRRLRLYELAGLVHDYLSTGDLRRLRERLLEVLLAHPIGCNAG